MKFAELCSVACHPSQPGFNVPAPGAAMSAFVFATENDRRFFAIQPRNHAPDPNDEPDFNPSVGIVGLSPADTQLNDFAEEYRVSGSYDKASRSCCFKGLAKDLILMMEATGAARQLGLTFIRRDTFDAHPDVLCDSLVRCGSVTAAGDSTDWKPGEYAVARTCVVKRFLPQILNPRFTRLKTVLILGDKGWDAINALEAAPGRTVYQAMVAAGKRVLWFPHPSGQNGEYVRLLKQRDFPTKEEFVDKQYRKYVADRARTGESMKKTEIQYKKKAATLWQGADELRRSFS